MQNQVPPALDIAQVSSIPGKFIRRHKVTLKLLFIAVLVLLLLLQAPLYLVNSLQ